MVKRLNQDDATLDDVGCRSRGVPDVRMGGGVGEHVLEISLEPEGEYSLSVVAGVIE